MFNAEREPIISGTIPVAKVGWTCPPHGDATCHCFSLIPGRAIITFHQDCSYRASSTTLCALALSKLYCSVTRALKDRELHLQRLSSCYTVSDTSLYGGHTYLI